MTVVGDTIPYLADSVIQLEEMGLNFSANIVFEDFRGDEENKKHLLQVYEDQLARLVEYYLQRPELSPFSPMLTSVPEYLGLPETHRKAVDENDCVRFCGAGHEMVTVDTDGQEYPCHRFLPWVCNRPAPNLPINTQKSWRPESCEACKLLPSCPTCAGYNWEENQDANKNKRQILFIKEG
ncbi:MAG: hypothetical protein GY765_39950 [bacterium]|nr:hypothetical protein [bacterium]